MTWFAKMNFFAFLSQKKHLKKCLLVHSWANVSFENQNSHIDLWAQSLFFLKSNTCISITLKLKVHSCTVQIYVWECWSIHVLNRSSIRAMCVYYSYFIAHVQIWKGRNKCRWLRLKLNQRIFPSALWYTSSCNFIFQ